MKHTIQILLASIILFQLSGCGDDEGIDVNSFAKIYDHSQAEISFSPIDITPLTEGYLILAGKQNQSSTYMGVSLHEINAEGNYRREIDLSDELVLPTGKMILLDSIAHFVAMDPVTFESQLVSIDADFNRNVTPLNRLFPLAINWSNANELILLSYDPENLETELSVFDLAGNALSSSSWSIGPGSDVQQSIINHYVEPDKERLPFFCGQWADGEFYFNGFYNYNLSLVFAGADGNVSGIVQGQGTNGGLSNIMPISGSNFAIVGYQFEEVFVLPSATLGTGGVSSSIDLAASSISEFRGRTPSAMSNVEVAGTSYTVIAAETESRQIALYLYSPEGVLSSIQKIGFAIPFTISSVKKDEEDNLLVLGTTFVGGRFERIYLEKISNQELRNWVK
jgi:hypothetical protein